MFDQPTHTESESIQLYEYLNHRANELLRSGHSVVFDTNFNFASDRQKLQDIAKQNDAICKVVWMTTPVAIAGERAVHAPRERNGYMVGMTQEQFDSIVSKLEPPTKNENIIKIDNTTLDSESAIRILGI